MKTLCGVLIAIVMTISCFSIGHTLPVTTSKTILINADTVRYYASFIHSSATINDLTINFGTGASNEELLRVTLAVPRELLPQSIIRVTVGTNPPTADNDPIVGISDGVYINQFILIEDASSTASNVYPCDIQGGGGGSINQRLGPHGNIIAGNYIMVFDPIHNFGSCTTNNGFASGAKFNNHVDPSKGLDLVISRDDSSEQYVFHYFLVEFL